MMVAVILQNQYTPNKQTRKVIVQKELQHHIQKMNLFVYAVYIVKIIPLIWVSQKHHRL